MFNIFFWKLKLWRKNSLFLARAKKQYTNETIDRKCSSFLTSMNPDPLPDQLLLDIFDLDLADLLASLEADRCRDTGPLTAHRASHHIPHGRMWGHVPGHTAAAHQKVLNLGRDQTAQGYLERRGGFFKTHFNTVKYPCFWTIRGTIAGMLYHPRNLDTLTLTLYIA